jgi:protein-disulfide isomerase
MLNKLFISVLLVLFSFVAVAQEDAKPEAVKPAEVSDKTDATIAPELPAKSANEVLAISDKDVVLGDKNAPVTIIEYASMTCHHCADFHNKVFDELKTKYVDTGKVKFVFRDFPLDEPAMRGSMLARCASKNGHEQFLKFTKVMFSTQGDWAGKKNYLEVLSNIAKLGGMKGEDFESCMADKELEKQIIVGKFDAAKSLQIRSTPSFFINGELHNGAKDVKYMSEAIDAAIGGVKVNVKTEEKPEAEVDKKEPVKP